MNDFDYYLTLGCCILVIIAGAGFCIYLWASRKYKDDIYIQEILAFTFCNTLLLSVVIFTAVMEILYKIYY